MNSSAPAASTGVAPAVAILLRAEGDWFATRAALTALRSQDYPRLAVLVLAEPEGETAQRIRAEFAEFPVAAPVSGTQRGGLFGRSGRSGRPLPLAGEANNRGASLIRGADYLMFASDRVALAPDAISQLMADATAAEGVVGALGPKLVDARDGATLRDLGGSVDRLGVKIPTAGTNERDQAQHDEARDLFVAPTEALTVRADLFAELGGFDPLLDGDGAVVDLCWRVHLAGGRVRVVPAAKATLRPASFDSGARQREYRSRLRTLGKCYGWVHLGPVVALAALSGLGEALFALVRGRFAQASDVALAWLWNLRHLGGTLLLRRSAKRTRRVRDAEVRRMQQGGSARLTDWLRYRLSPEGGAAARTTIDESILGTWRRNAHRTYWVGWLAVLGVLAFGSRSLLVNGVGAYGQFAAFPSAGELTGAYLDGWRTADLGARGIGHPAMGLLGLAATVLGGAAGLLRHLAIWGLLAAGLVGIWKLSAASLSRSGRLITLALYAACPLPYNAVALGRWDVLLAYGSAPLVVLLAGRLVSDELAGSAADSGADLTSGPSANRARRGSFARVATLGLLLAVVAAFEPFIVVMAVGVGVILTLVALARCLATRDSPAACLAGLAGVLGAAGWAVLAHLPWIVEFGSIRAYLSASLGSPAAAGSHSGPNSLAELLRFSTGPLGGLPLGWAPLGWGLLVAAAIPLLVARGARFWWSLRGWLVALFGLGAAWVIASGWAKGRLDWALDSDALPASLAGVSLAFGAVGLCWAATSIGPSLAAQGGDAPPRVRPIALAVSAVAIGATLAPTAWASLDGRWGAPEFDHRVPLGLIDDRDVGPDYRVLWLGHPDVMPLRGTPVGLGDGLNSGDETENESGTGDLLAATSIRGFPDVRQALAVPSTDGMDRLVEALRVGLAGDTLRLGRLLGPFGIRYVVVLERSGPSYADGWARPVAPAVAEALASQIDLRPVAADPSVMVFQNEAWWSSRAQFERRIPAGFGDHPLELVVSDLTDGIGVLTDYRSPTSQHGHLGSGPLLVADTYDPGWKLRIGDREAGPARALGWAMQFEPPYAGQAELRYERAAIETDRLTAQIAVWLIIVWVAVGQPFPFAARAANAIARLFRRAK